MESPVNGPIVVVNMVEGTLGSVWWVETMEKAFARGVAVVQEQCEAAKTDILQALMTEDEFVSSEGDVRVSITRAYVG